MRFRLSVTRAGVRLDPNMSRLRSRDGVSDDPEMVSCAKLEKDLCCSGVAAFRGRGYVM